MISSHLVQGEVGFDVSLDESSWLWVELETDEHAATIRDAGWSIEDVVPGTAAVCITTHDRGADCLGVLRRLADDPLVLDHIDRIYVVDQGTRHLEETNGFDAVAALLGDQLRVVRQANLGGSGGFSRGMVEALDGEAGYALLLDDDVLLEPESIRRMLAFAAAAEGDVIVGAHMLSLTDRTLLHTMGERIRRRGFWWGPVEPALAPVDLAAAAIESTPALSRVHAVDFNGWWMCLVPLSTVRQIGVALPMFIKWDDAEFGLRATRAGIPTVTLPGAALWHMPWTGKDDGLDWQAYYQLRNRLVTALVHSGGARGGGVISATVAQDVNHILCMQYGSAAARRAAIRDILRGPSHLPQTIAHRIFDMKELMAQSGQVVVDTGSLPRAQRTTVPNQPVGMPRVLRRMMAVAVHQLSRPRTRPDATVDLTLSRAEGKWWALGLLNSATVASATGAGGFVAVRRRRSAGVLLRDAFVLRTVLWVRWPRLARDYRAAVGSLASPEGWRPLFSKTPPDTAPH